MNASPEKGRGLDGVGRWHGLHQTNRSAKVGSYGPSLPSAKSVSLNARRLISVASTYRAPGIRFSGVVASGFFSTTQGVQRYLQYHQSNQRVLKKPESHQRRPECVQRNPEYHERYPSGRRGRSYPAVDHDLPSERPSAGRLKARQGRRPRPEQRPRSGRALCREGGRERGFRYDHRPAGEVTA